MEHSSAPLLPHVKNILVNMGYKPQANENLFMKSTPSVIAKFMQVTQSGVMPYGIVPRQQEETHLAFVMRHMHYLFK